MKNAKQVKPPTEDQIYSIGYYLVTGRVKICINADNPANKIAVIFTNEWPPFMGPYSLNHRIAIYTISKIFGGPEPELLTVYSVDGLLSGYMFKLRFAPEHTPDIVNICRRAIIAYVQRETRKIQEAGAEAAKGLFD